MRNSLSYSPELSTQQYANRACSKPHPNRAVGALGQNLDCRERTWIAAGQHHLGHRHSCSLPLLSRGQQSPKAPGTVLPHQEQPLALADLTTSKR